MQADGGAKLTVDRVSEWIRAHPDGAAIAISVVALGVAVVAYRRFNAHSDRSGVIDSATCHVCTGRGMHASEVCESAGLMFGLRIVLAVVCSVVAAFFGLGSLWPLLQARALKEASAMQQAGTFAEATWAAVIGAICLFCAVHVAAPLRTRLVLRCNRCGYTVPRS